MPAVVTTGDSRGTFLRCVTVILMSDAADVDIGETSLCCTAAALILLMRCGRFA